MQIYVYAAGQQHGPLPVEEIRQKLDDGIWVREGSLACPVGAKEWIPLAQIQGLQPDGTAFPPPPPPPPPSPDDAFATIVPYRNPSALISYYLGIFALLPAIGFFLAIPAIILGVKG